MSLFFSPLYIYRAPLVSGVCERMKKRTTKGRFNDAYN